jgi:hypothetical protein
VIDLENLLKAQVPLREEASPDWADVLERVGREGARSSVLRRPRLLVPVLLAVALTLAGAAAATVAAVRWWGSGGLRAIDTTAAEKLAELTLTASFSVWRTGDTIAIWRFPQPNGGVCVFTALASPRPSPAGSGGANPTGGGFCGMSDRTLPPGQTIGVSRSATLQGSVYRWLINGPVDPDSGIARLELRSATGKIPLGYGHDWFLAELPGTSNTASELPPGGPYVLVGYDSDGNEVARVDLAHPLRDQRER